MYIDVFRRSEINRIDDSNYRACELEKMCVLYDVQLTAFMQLICTTKLINSRLIKCSRQMIKSLSIIHIFDSELERDDSNGNYKKKNQKICKHVERKLRMVICTA